MCEKWNASFVAKMLRFGAWLIYLFSRKQHYLAASRLSLSSALVLMRLVWVLENIPQVSKAINKGEILFGTLDTWLLWMLTDGEIHATDPSNASVTGFYDPYQLKWSDVALRLFNIPTEILPLVKSTSDNYGTTVPEVFGSPIRISAMVGDQQASMFGQRCFSIGDMNCTMGTGAFFDVNTGPSINSSNSGSVYQLVGWQIAGKTTYIAECGNSDTGTIMTWAKSWGLFEDIHQSSKFAFSVKDNGGVFFRPPFNKLQLTKDCEKNKYPWTGTSMFTGLKPDTTKAHMGRAVLEAVIFQAYSLYESLSHKVDFVSDKIRICGGVSNNDFLMHVLATLLSKPVIRSDNIDSSSLGAAFLAGLESGVWKNIEDLLALPITEQVFHSQQKDVIHYRQVMEEWRKVAATSFF